MPQDVMSQPSPQERQAFVQRVQSNLGRVSVRVSSLRRASSGLQLTSILTSGAGTFVTGFTAASGPAIGAGIEGWRLACMVGAVLGFFATVSTALFQQLKTGDRLAQAQLCAARLRLLEIEAARQGDWSAVTKEYAEIVKSYPDLLA
jgi:hypothetical protein